MGFQCGIVGLPNVGKSTLYNALTQSKIDAANYPFCTIEPNVGIVALPDTRLNQLAKIVSPQQVIPTTMKFVDIAGLVAGAASGEGLGNKFLAHIREVQAIAHVVRCFEDEEITHVNGMINPLSDIETIDTELCLADLESISKAIIKNGKLLRTGDKDAKKRQVELDKINDFLSNTGPLREMESSELANEIIHDLQLLSAKPIILVTNVKEGQFDDNPYVEQVESYAKAKNIKVVAVCAAIEAEIVELDESDKAEFLAELGLEQSGLDNLITTGYDILGLQTFFTAGEKEVRAWTVATGSSAQQAAGVIHTDFIKGFIRAEIIAFDDYISCGGENAAKESGLWRLEGKDYTVKDGDVIYFRVNS